MLLRFSGVCEFKWFKIEVLVRQKCESILTLDRVYEGHHFDIGKNIEHVESRKFSHL